MSSRPASVTLGIVVVFLLMTGGAGSAQERYPSRPITLVVHVAPGGASTVNAQLLKPHLEKALGVGVMIVNKPGGAGTIAWNFVSNSPPDGYTVAHINPSLLITQYTTKTGVPYGKFTPLAHTVTIPAAVVVKADSPWNTFKEFIEYAKANPEKIQMANSGHGAMYHIGILGIEMATGVKFTHVPFKGSGPCITAMLGGHADGSLIEISTILPHIQANKLKALAVSSTSRNFALPSVPTFKEYGFELDVGTWYGYAVPKGTPPDRVKALQDAFKEAVGKEDFKSPYQKQGGVVEYMGPAEMSGFLAQQDQLWKRILDYSGFKPTD